MRKTWKSISSGEKSPMPPIQQYGSQWSKPYNLTVVELEQHWDWMIASRAAASALAAPQKEIPGLFGVAGDGEQLQEIGTRCNSHAPGANQHGQTAGSEELRWEGLSIPTPEQIEKFSEALET
ncbi:hypothetical protein WISP_51030 [Willisornis vidua]|uniref:Uncharacterized protein n=1 Tax=Willisornis vidua TaxID=1566151 RepID=A0ABQ9DED0_9PASS|nr:hypothetical protein WISP_51030 [Willisornis vidua]